MANMKLIAFGAVALSLTASPVGSSDLTPGKSEALRLALPQPQEISRMADEELPLHSLAGGDVTFGVRRIGGEVWGPSLAEPKRPGLDEAGLEVSIAATGPAEFGVAIARRQHSERWAGGSVEQNGGEVRLGQRLSIDEFASPTWDAPTWYLYAAADGQAVTWAPAAANLASARGLRLQEDRVMVDDMQAGVSIEARNMQASLAFMQREVSNGQRSEDQNYAGVSFSWRR